MFEFLFGEEYQEWLASASRVTALKRPVEHLKRSGFVVTKKSPIGGGAVLGRGHEG